MAQAESEALVQGFERGEGDLVEGLQSLHPSWTRERIAKDLARNRTGFVRWVEESLPRIRYERRQRRTVAVYEEMVGLRGDFTEVVARIAEIGKRAYATLTKRDFDLLVTHYCKGVRWENGRFTTRRRSIEVEYKVTGLYLDSLLVAACGLN